MSNVLSKVRGYRFLSFLYSLIKYTALFFPYIYIFILHKDEYFTETNTASMWCGIVLCILIMILIIAGQAKLFKGIVLLMVMFGVSYLLNPAMIHLPTYIGFGMIGYLVYLLFDNLHKNVVKKAVDILATLSYE